MSAATPTVDTGKLREVLGRFTTGVTIITCIDASGVRVGLTANSFNALSLAPPLVLWSLRTVSPSMAAFRLAPHFVVNVLAESQVDLSRRFASKNEDRFADGVWSAGLGGAPVLAGAAAVLQCQAFAQHELGDHVLFIGQVQALSDAPVPPLVYQAGHYRLLGEVL